MGVRNNNKAVDFRRLEAEFKKRGLHANEVAIQLGRTLSYFGGMKKKGYLPHATIIMLDSLLNIKYEDIMPMIEAEEVPSFEETEQTEIKPTITMTKQELRYIITEAVKDAFTWYANK